MGRSPRIAENEDLAKCFTDEHSLIAMIRGYVAYYDSRRIQRNLGILTPTEKHNLYLAA